jgi:coenzyme F420-0:L-glutamate ligase/coenzyme F420-1:gamma-L-glutamate ligase
VQPLQIWPLAGLPEFHEGDDLAGALLAAIDGAGLGLDAGDVLVVTQKVVSKVEGAVVQLDTIEPSPLAIDQAARWGKDARQVEVVLRESARIVRMDRGVIISETRHGWVCANAGVDASNVPQGYVTLLPVDADASARGIREAIRARTGVAPAVIISDTFGRPWRDGLTNVAIGMAGIEPLRDYKGQVDEFGHSLQVTVLADGDELAAAAELVMGKLDKVPAALVRGFGYQVTDERGASAYVRPPGMDMFR